MHYSRLSYKKGGFDIAPITLLPQGTLFVVKPLLCPYLQRYKSATPEISKRVECRRLAFSSPHLPLVRARDAGSVRSWLSLRRDVSVSGGLWRNMARKVALLSSVPLWPLLETVTSVTCNSDGEGKYYDLDLLFHLTLYALCSLLHLSEQC
jgi:hypothetical protein